MKAPTRIAWTRLLDDLIQSGLSLPKIAQQCRVGISTPYRWKDGSEPLYCHGVVLLALHRSRCGPESPVVAQ